MIFQIYCHPGPGWGSRLNCTGESEQLMLAHYVKQFRMSPGAVCPLPTLLLKASFFFPALFTNVSEKQSNKHVFPYSLP